MKISQKLTLSFLVVALLVWITGFISTNYSKKALKEIFVANAGSITEELLDQIDRDIYHNIEIFQAYTRDSILVEGVEESNRAFEKKKNVDDYIEKQERSWRAAGESVTPLCNLLCQMNLPKS